MQLLDGEAGVEVEEPGARRGERAPIAEHVAILQDGDLRAAIDEAADHHAALVVVVFGDGIDQVRRHRAHGTGHDLADVRGDRIEPEGAFLDVPAVVAALDDEIHFLDVVLSGVADVQIAREADRSCR